jgi:hypothetical protein
MTRVSFALLVLPSLFGYAAGAPAPAPTCGDMKSQYKQQTCCGSPTKEVQLSIVPGPKIRLDGPFNPCHEKKPGWANHDCIIDGAIEAIEQSGGDVTLGFKGTLNTSVVPITKAYFAAGLCPVNVHWHLGAEHRSAGQYDENGVGPGLAGTPSNHVEGTRRLSEDAEAEAEKEPERRLAATTRYGYACNLYKANDAKFTTAYNWQHCVNMHVGETYEVHWPHSALGACHTPNQYQFPFYDGVFCGYDGISALSAETVAGAVGVQSQIFTIVNDESYYYPDLMRGMITDGPYGKNITAYTGSTTGTTRDNVKCSPFGPITWQVDRVCHLISASTFDKMCADMKQQRDDMSGDLYAHGARELVNTQFTANNQVDCPTCIPNDLR